MEQSQQPQDRLFGLSVDEPIKSHLFETAKWGRFLAIVGFVVCGLIVIVGIALAVSFNDISSRYSRYESYNDRSIFEGMGTTLVVVYLVIAVLYFFPCLFLLRFSNKMKAALAAEDQSLLATSFQNLKVLFRYVGVLTIIIITLYTLGFLARLLST